MADNYAVLYSKYQRSMVAVSDLEQQRDRYQKELDRMTKESKQIEKNVRTLCETILKKDRETGDGSREVWFRKSLLELVADAQDSLERYFPGIEGMLRSLLEHNEQRTKMIAELKRQLKDSESKAEERYSEMEKRKDAVIEKLSDQLKSGNGQEVEEIDALVDQSKQELVDLDMPLNDGVSFHVEDDDDISDDVGEAAEALFDMDEAVLKKVPKINFSEKTKRKIKEKIGDVIEIKAAEVQAQAEKLDDIQKLLIGVIGDTGYSQRNDIYEEALKRNPNIKSESRIKTALYGLRGDIKQGKNVIYVIIDIRKCPVPGSGNFNVYSLTNFGKTLYRFLFGKEPHEAEMDVVIRHHGTLEHGYGILKTAEMISEMAFVRNSGAKVISLTRRKDYAIKTKDNSSYIPDIILIQKMKDEEQRRYLEYETGKCTKSDFFAKCNKIASFSRYLNFIVPNQEVKNYLLGEIEEWKEQILAPGAFPGKGTIHIRVATYDELKKGDSRHKLPWPPEKTISLPKKERERRGDS